MQGTAYSVGALTSGLQLRLHRVYCGHKDIREGDFILYFPRRLDRLKSLLNMGFVLRLGISSYELES